MTDEEKEKLKKLPVDDLVSMLDAERTAREQAEGKFAEERKKIIHDFFDGAGEAEQDEEGGEVFKKQLERLKKRFI